MPRLFHFSEDPAIASFKPRAGITTSNSQPFVWAIDEAHAPSYWFPRDCPRACCWPGDAPMSDSGRLLLGFGGAERMHAIEHEWLTRVRNCELYAYEFDCVRFTSHIEEAGYWVADQEIVPISVEPVGDLLQRHFDAAIEFRVVNNLWPLIDAIVLSGLEFSIIRKANAKPRLTLPTSAPR